MGETFRRVVTGHDSNGKAVVWIDGTTPTLVKTPAVTLAEMWQTTETPARIADGVDTAVGMAGLEPPRGGTFLRLVEIQPEDRSISREEALRANAEMYAAINASHCQPDTTRHPGMHKTRTIDYIVILRGKVRLLLDEGDVELKPFDVVIQRGTNHAWVVDGPESAMFAAFMVDATPAEGR